MRVETVLGDWRKWNHGVQLRSHTFQEYCEKDNLGVFLLSCDNAGVSNKKPAHLTTQLENEDAQGQRRFTSCSSCGTPAFDRIQHKELLMLATTFPRTVFYGVSDRRLLVERKNKWARFMTRFWLSADFAM